MEQSGLGRHVASTLVDEGQIRARIAKGELRTVSRNADVIAQGVITSIMESRYVTDDGLEGTMWLHTLRITSHVKGMSGADDLTFMIPGLNKYMPAWTRFTPMIEVGQELVVFLRKEARGLYLFAGRNSVLRVEGETLLFNSVVEYPKSRSQVIREIVSEVDRETR